MIDNILITKEIVEALERLMLDRQEDLDKLFSLITDNFPEYHEMSMEKCPGIYVAAPSATILSSSLGPAPANWIEVTGIESRRLIAGQPPQVGSMNNFWLAVWENNVTSILDLRRPDEYEYGEFNITKYWPSERGESVILDSCSVAYESASEMESAGLPMLKYEYILLHRGTQMKKIITRYEYRQWINLKAVSGEKLLLFCQFLESIFNNNKRDENTYIHCRGGVGRTGMLLTSYFMYYQIRNKILDNTNVIQGLLRTIAQCRWARGRLFVCNAEQLGAILLLTKFLISGSDGEEFV